MSVLLPGAFESSTIINSLPCAAWIKDKELKYIESNDKFTNLTIIDKKWLLGNNDYQLPWEKYAEEYRNADKEVLNGKTLAILHPVVLSNNTEITIISRKSPVKDRDSNIIGVMGLVTVVHCHRVIKSFKILNQVDAELTALIDHQSNQYSLNAKYKDYKLTKKDMQCLFLFIRSKTSKEIGKLLGLSPRTIESRIENIKYKFNCRTKSELIDKVIESGLFNIIPGSVNLDILSEVFDG